MGLLYIIKNTFLMVFEKISEKYFHNPQNIKKIKMREI